MRIAARLSPASAARWKKSRAEATSPAARQTSPRATRAVMAPAGSRSPVGSGAGGGEHTMSQAIDDRGITPRGNRDQRQTLCGEEGRPTVRRQLITNERLDLVTVEPLDVQMRCEPLLEEVW